ncbi:MAG: hypothetical protein QM621_07590 [Aeromicrobium sp.]|uniref:hypothetical protein n=1 Tax=Aeromicrobium sp. TaxID=1871063 RepID=UPI0039E31224
MMVPTPAVRHSLHAVATAEPLEVAGSQALELPEDALLRRFGASPDDLAALAERPHVTVLHRSGPLADVRRDVVAARLEALTLAAQHDGLVLDLVVPRLVAHHADQTDPNTAAQWVALDLDGPDVVSLGLATFGLPELRVVDVDPSALAVTLAVLTGLVHRLLVEWPANDPLGSATVTLSDIALGLGQPDPRDRAGVALEISFHDDELLVAFTDDPQELFR